MNKKVQASYSVPKKVHSNTNHLKHLSVQPRSLRLTFILDDSAVHNLSPALMLKALYVVKRKVRAWRSRWWEGTEPIQLSCRRPEFVSLHNLRVNLFCFFNSNHNLCRNLNHLLLPNFNHSLLAVTTVFSSLPEIIYPILKSLAFDIVRHTVIGCNSF